ncbi:hypothetical protein Golax_001261 [Gossypium laxum]|uniref:PGG domain-containing protein n=1 Tax=Gossypium laxum TaxID=34288 RepID=A0A7J9AW97_9ROSI|nr:hypothetical protein [Gossypium laxum]
MGSSEICQVLINHMSGGKIEAGEKLIRVVNKNHYTALHDAITPLKEQNECLTCSCYSVNFILANHLTHKGFIDQQDNEGNTALHLAVLRGRHGKIFKSMIEDVQVDKAIVNSAGHTVIDILLMQEQNFIFKVMAQMRVSVIANVLAFSFSNVSMSLHFYSSLKQKLDVLAFYTNYTTLLTSLAIIPTAVAFASGSYISLSFTPAFAKTVLSVGCSAYAFLYYLWFY